MVVLKSSKISRLKRILSFSNVSKIFPKKIFYKNFKSKKNKNKRMKFVGALILELVRGSLYTDENLYHEDNADGKHG